MMRATRSLLVCDPSGSRGRRTAKKLARFVDDVVVVETVNEAKVWTRAVGAHENLQRHHRSGSSGSIPFGSGTEAARAHSSGTPGASAVVVVHEAFFTKTKLLQELVDVLRVADDAVGGTQRTHDQLQRFALIVQCEVRNAPPTLKARRRMRRDLLQKPAFAAFDDALIQPFTTEQARLLLRKWFRNSSFSNPAPSTATATGAAQASPRRPSPLQLSLFEPEPEPKPDHDGYLAERSPSEASTSSAGLPQIGSPTNSPSSVRRDAKRFDRQDEGSAARCGSRRFTSDKHRSRRDPLALRPGTSDQVSQGHAGRNRLDRDKHYPHHAGRHRSQPRRPQTVPHSPITTGNGVCIPRGAGRRHSKHERSSSKLDRVSRAGREQRSSRRGARYAGVRRLGAVEVGGDQRQRSHHRTVSNSEVQQEEAFDSDDETPIQFNIYAHSQATTVRQQEIQSLLRAARLRADVSWI